MKQPWRELVLPLSADTIAGLKAGDKLMLSGTIYAARDAAHKRFIEALDRGERLPVDLGDSLIYYMGPTPTRPGDVIGSCGPTTSARMDKYTPRLIVEGLRLMMGKGNRSPEVVAAIREYGAVYLVTLGGAGALLSARVKSAEILAYPELEAEAVLKMEIERFPVIVAIDGQGNDLFKTGPEQYRKA
ncbi:MAG: Fe-S-containing hydro-lyase [Dehalogenimonas sp.]|uniref:Fe-S-containing hydro-lyase n=1 Tax=Candidatus Dehalogenimonas loeffleri TaxID=3127115 RepID=A0ABZ2J1U5_9CHLR|nr:Fe-S-containing hydro-lyase [Dehalogenimonas sp.]